MAMQRKVGQIASFAIREVVEVGRPSGAGEDCAVRNSDSDDCSIIDAHTEREVARVKVGKGPKRVLVVKVPAS